MRGVSLGILYSTPSLEINVCWEKGVVIQQCDMAAWTPFESIITQAAKQSRSFAFPLPTSGMWAELMQWICCDFNPSSTDLGVG